MPTLLDLFTQYDDARKLSGYKDNEVASAIKRQILDVASHTPLALQVIYDELGVLSQAQAIQCIKNIVTQRDAALNAMVAGGIAIEPALFKVYAAEVDELKAEVAALESQLETAKAERASKEAADDSLLIAAHNHDAYAAEVRAHQATKGALESWIKIANDAKAALAAATKDPTASTATTTFYAEDGTPGNSG